MLAAPHCDDLRQNRDCDLVRGNGAEIEAGRRLELGQLLGGDAPLGQCCLQCFGLFAAADESDVVGIDSKRSEQCVDTTT